IQLVEHWLKLDPKVFNELFDIVIQCGAVLAVLIVFQKRVIELLRNLGSPTSRDYVLKLLIAFGITMVGVLAAEKFGLKIRKEDVSPGNWTTRVALATLIGGVLFLAIEAWLRNRPTRNEITWAVAIACGLAQVLAATFSGTSRSGATILFALALGIAR